MDGVQPDRFEKISCDLLCVSGGYQPVDSLLQQAGGRSSFDGRIGESVPTILPLNVFAAGDVVDYLGKLDLIATGDAEAAIAVNNAVLYVDPSARVNPGHSTNMRVFKE